jgi:hypothetical protein
MLAFELALPSPEYMVVHSEGWQVLCSAQSVWKSLQFLTGMLILCDSGVRESYLPVKLLVFTVFPTLYFLCSDNSNEPM